jgi:predicted transglutaminase-like cysteine proteinase
MMPAKHLRISPKLADDMMSYITEYWGVLDEITTPAMAWEGTCEDYELPKQWLEQAKVAKSMLNIVQAVSA